MLPRSTSAPMRRPSTSPGSPRSLRRCARVTAVRTSVSSATRARRASAMPTQLQPRSDSPRSRVAMTPPTSSGSTRTSRLRPRVRRQSTRRDAMAENEPAAELHPQFSSDDATPTPWAEARERLEKAEVYWLSTVRPDGRPHATPIAAIWLDVALYFTTGPTERKAMNLAQNTYCVVTTGCNVLEGLDLVVEGDAVRVTDEARLQRLADGYAAKYGQLFRFTVRDGAFYGEGSEIEVFVYELAPTTAFGVGKGTFSQTRWRF